MEDARAHDKLLRSTKFPSIFYNTTAIDPSKVNQAILNVWIDREITSLLGFEDEIVSNTATNLFGLTETPSNGEGSPGESFDPRNAHIVLSGFLGEAASLKFCTNLLELLLDASQQPMGIPRQLIEEKKRQLMASSATSTVTPVVPPACSDSSQGPHNHRKRPNRWDNNGENSGARSDRLQVSGSAGQRVDVSKDSSIDEYGRHRPVEPTNYAVVEPEPSSVREERGHSRRRRRRSNEDYPHDSSSRYRHDDSSEYHRRKDDTHSDERRLRSQEDRDYRRSRHDHRHSRDEKYRSRRSPSPDRDYPDRDYSRKRHRRRDRSP